MNDNKSIRDEDINVSVDQSDRLGGADYNEQISLKPVRGTSGIKSLFGKQNRVRIIFAVSVGVLVFAAMLYSFVTYVPQQPAQGGSGVVKTGQLYAERNAAPSQDQIEDAQRYNTETLPERQQVNPSEHPVIVVGEGGENPFGRALEAKPASRASNLGRTQEQGGDDGRAVSRSADAAGEPRDWKSTDIFIKGLMDDELAAPVAYSVDWSYKSPAAVRVAAVPPSLTEDRGSSVGTNKCANPATRAASMYIATTDLALNSDVGGPVSLTIQNGRLRNTKLTGKFERKEEWLRMDLDKLVTNQATLPVQAIGLDMNTTMNAVEGEANYHTLYRYGWWGFGSVLKAIGKAAEMNADSEVIISNGTALQTTQADTARELKIAVGSLGQDLGDVMRERLNRPVTVTLKVGDEVGVFFMDDVCLPNQAKGN